MARKKYPYQRKCKRKKSNEVVLIRTNTSILEVPKEHILLKVIAMEEGVWHYARNEEEALLIAELLTVSLKESFL